MSSGTLHFKSSSVACVQDVSYDSGPKIINLNISVISWKYLFKWVQKDTKITVSVNCVISRHYATLLSCVLFSICLHDDNKTTLQSSVSILVVGLLFFRWNDNDTYLVGHNMKVFCPCSCWKTSWKMQFCSCLLTSRTFLMLYQSVNWQTNSAYKPSATKL